MSAKKTNEEWRKTLSSQRYHILREKGTEVRGTGLYNEHNETGVYLCAACHSRLYESSHKFSSGCGWPAFFDSVPGAVNRNLDTSFGRIRTEITCSNCDSHLGHVFQGEGYNYTPADERHCVNSLSLKFERPDGSIDDSEDK